MHEHHEMHESCKERFKDIISRIEEGEMVFSQHTTEIAVVKTNMENLVKSMNALTKALWGLCGTVLSVLIGFFVWYIQSL